MALLKSILAVVTAFLLFCGLSLSLSITQALSLKPSGPERNLSSNHLKDGHLKARCTDSPSWVGGGYDSEDCASALRLLFFTEVRQRPLVTYEFLTQHAIPSFTHPIIQTPRRYIHGSCTVAIAMLEIFQGSGVILPDQPPTLPTLVSDLSNWQGLWRSMVRVQWRCVRDGVMGWDVAGNEGGIGLFMWATGSWMDRSVP